MAARLLLAALLLAGGFLLLGQIFRPANRNPPAFSDHEAPAGAVNGSNAVYTLSRAPFPQSGLHVFRNGLLQKSGTDYSVSGNTITFSAAPVAGDTLETSYRY